MVGALAGVLLGVVSGLLVPTGPDVGSVTLSVGCALALLGLPVLVLGAVRLSAVGLLAAAPLVGWLVAALALSESQLVSPGDVLLEARPASYVYLFGGVLAGAVAASTAPALLPRRAPASSVGVALPALPTDAGTTEGVPSAEG